MKITVKTTQQKVFQVEVEPAQTVADLKVKIQESQGHLAGGQKIIFSGQILTDDKTVESCGIKEKDFLVLMVAKPKPVPSTSIAVAPAPISAETSELPAAPVPAVAQTDPSAAATAAPTMAESSVPAVSSESQPTSTPAPAPGFGDPSSFLAGDHLQSAINGMVEMGFPRDQVLKAMRASFNNADRAVEYLMTGIPAHLEDPQAAAQVGTPSAPQLPTNPTSATSQTPAQSGNQPQNLFQLAQQQQQGGTGGSVPTTGAATPVAPPLNLDALRDNPQIQQLRQQLDQNPELIQPLIQQLATQNPMLAQAFAQDPAALLRILGLDVDGDEEGVPPPGSHVINVTEEERAAIQRLENLGFPRQVVLEAYFACDKNEELAANYLFENNFGD
ncbi:hypothetical protein CPB83DRAFT_848408 [Crepidotus variabilis]|uniref:UV excision repair protein RAD23 n=1 Tax=Crepidotus variabilis TaxID=179855 RepID=A0A9P6EM41_9AGAR|nr:hypothetical protein CPB83DRAFT_848408 [Crepidotus variabilis]